MESLIRSMGDDDTEAALKEISSSLRSFICEWFFVDEEILKDSTSFMERAIIDSTGFLELVEFLEQTFSITIEDDEAIPENLDSVANVRQYVLRKWSAERCHSQNPC